MATSPRRGTAVKKAGSSSARRRVAVPKPAPPVEPEVEETEELETEAPDLEAEDNEEEEMENVNEEEVPESIKQLAEDALAAADEDDLDSMPVLTIQMIQEAQDRTEEWVPVKEWGGKMLVRSISASAMFEILGGDNETMGVSEDGGVKLDLSVKSMQKAILQNGIAQPVITDEAFEILMQKSTAPVMRVLNAIMRNSKLGGEKGKDPVQEEVKTFRPTGER